MVLSDLLVALGKFKNAVRWRFKFLQDEEKNTEDTTEVLSDVSHSEDEYSNVLNTDKFEGLNTGLRS